MKSAYLCLCSVRGWNSKKDCHKAKNRRRYLQLCNNSSWGGSAVQGGACRQVPALADRSTCPSMASATMAQNSNLAISCASRDVFTWELTVPKFALPNEGQVLRIHCIRPVPAGITAIGDQEMSLRADITDRRGKVISPLMLKPEAPVNVLRGPASIVGIAIANRGRSSRIPLSQSCTRCRTRCLKPHRARANTLETPCCQGRAASWKAEIRSRKTTGLRSIQVSRSRSANLLPRRRRCRAYTLRPSFHALQFSDHFEK